MPKMSLEVVWETNLLDKLILAIPGIGDEVLEQLANDVWFDAIDYVPVDTGYLQSTIGKAQIRPGVWAVFALAHYASYVEYGTSRMEAQPYLVPALENADFIGALKAVLRSKVGL